MTSCFVARIFNPGERFGKPFYEVDVPSPLRVIPSSSEIVFVTTPKELRHIAQGCSRSELPWVWNRNGRCTPKGFRHRDFSNDATLSG